MADTTNTAPLRDAARLAPGATLRVQSILFNSDAGDIALAAASLARAADFAIQSGAFRAVEMAYGDCSPTPCLDDDFLARLHAENPELAGVDYTFFGANLGSARGHNRLLELSGSDAVVILNPDVRMSPQTLARLAAPIAAGGVGMTEARQVPIEHPKEFDTATGQTSWASTACAMIPMAVARTLSGFDADNFFLYCDDVDFSWRVRLAGLSVVFVPAATVFHDKRLSSTAGWQSGAAERYYSAEASLLMAWKWSRPDLTRNYLAHFEGPKGDEFMKRAAAEFRRRESAGILPVPLDPGHHIGQFVGFNYAKHRFAI